MRQRSKLRQSLNLRTGLLLAITISAAVTAGVAGLWNGGDWVNFAIALALGVYFYLLAKDAGALSEKRSVAVANAELITSTGALAMSSARSLSGSEASALRVGADARAALQHYPLADAGTQEVLARSVSDAYVDLAFSTFSRADTLGRSVWDRLCEGTAAVVAEADRLAEGDEGRPWDPVLARVADDVSFVELLGRAIRENPGPELGPAQTIVLPSVWDPARLPRTSGRSTRVAANTQSAYRLDRFERLYSHELTVWHDWQVLKDHAAQVECVVELADIRATDQWLAPWYVGRHADGHIGPMGVLGGPLSERAKHDVVAVEDAHPMWPDGALRHGALPHGMRTTGIANLRRWLRDQRTRTICALAYDVRRGGAATERLVLDGNHRIAAARSMMREAGSGQTESEAVRVLTFVIRELEPVDDDDTSTADSGDVRWRGFTPDIGLVRGTWPAPGQ